MSPEARVYRGIIIRAVTGDSPATVVSVADNERLSAICEQLARAERVANLFTHKGYALAGDPIDKTAASLPLPIRPR